jgi:RNA polymerase sigma-54 factor
MLVHGDPRDHQKTGCGGKSEKPLSDSKIAGLLEAQGIQVARRTVAKYRESLGIAPSSERKRLM